MNQNFYFPEKHMPGHSKYVINHHSEAQEEGKQSEGLIRSPGLPAPLPPAPWQPCSLPPGGEQISWRGAWQSQT